VREQKRPPAWSLCYLVTLTIRSGTWGNVAWVTVALHACGDFTDKSVVKSEFVPECSVELKELVGPLHTEPDTAVVVGVVAAGPVQAVDPHGAARPNAHGLEPPASSTEQYGDRAYTHAMLRHA
jgi:hypothetical protein